MRTSTHNAYQQFTQRTAVRFAIIFRSMLWLIRCATTYCLCFLFVPLAHADVWEFRKDGSVTSHRMPDYLRRADLHESWKPVAASELAARRVKYHQLIGGLSLAHDVDTQLVHAVIEVESAYDARAVSSAGAMGLMQLMPATAERFQVRNPLDAAENIEAGIQYLSILYREFENIELVLAAYNAGEKAVRHYGNTVPPFRETRNYIKHVLAVLDRERPDASK